MKAGLSHAAGWTLKETRQRVTKICPMWSVTWPSLLLLSSFAPPASATVTPCYSWGTLSHDSCEGCLCTCSPLHNVLQTAIQHAHSAHLDNPLYSNTESTHPFIPLLSLTFVSSYFYSYFLLFIIHIFSLESKFCERRNCFGSLLCSQCLGKYLALGKQSINICWMSKSMNLAEHYQNITKIIYA